MELTRARRRLMTVVPLLAFCLGSGQVQAVEKNILFILDASGSMAQKLGDQTKMQAAKLVFGNLLADLPEGVDVGLEVYGHHGDKDCSVIEVMNPVAPLDAASITANVQGLTPKHGATPMATALETGAEALQAVLGEKAIVLISDGKETCGGDPAAAAKKLKAQGIDITTHVVGLGVNAEEKAQLLGIAEAGGGKYYAANNADELKKSLIEIRETVVKKTVTVIFDEEFDTEFLSDAWEIKNDVADSRILDDGILYLMTGPEATESEKVQNLFLYGETISANSYEVSTKFNVTIPDYGMNGKTQYVGLILYKDKDNLMVVVIFGKFGYNQRYATIGKRQGGEWVSWAEVQVGPWSDQPANYLLKIVKQKFNYSAYAKIEGDQQWREIGSMGFLAKSLKPGIIANRNPGAREVMAEFDWFKIIGKD